MCVFVTVARQGPGNDVVRVTVGAFLSAIAAAVLGVLGAGSIALLAAKALAVGLLALFVSSIAAIKHLHVKHDSGGGQTVHYVPVPHQTHYDFYHDRHDYISPYMAD